MSLFLPQELLELAQVNLALSQSGELRGALAKAIEMVVKARDAATIRRKRDKRRQIGSAVLRTSQPPPSHTHIHPPPSRRPQERPGLAPRLVSLLHWRCLSAPHSRGPLVAALRAGLEASVWKPVSQSTSDGILPLKSE